MYNHEQNGGPTTQAWRCTRMGQKSLRPIAILFLILMTITQSTLAFHKVVSRSNGHSSSLTARAADNSSLLECLEVAPPILSPSGGCQQTLMVYTFALSYGQPFVGDYAPPECDFNRVAIEFTVTSAGRQFDRLALMYLDDIEVWRTSTAEPTSSGIIWTYTKDMSAYSVLFRSPHKLIFDLGNLIDDTYTGSWNTTLTATFFTADDTTKPADIILPVSARRSAANQPSAFVVPDTKAINTLELPKNTEKAVFTISACGQAAEEFWWSNVFNSDTKAFGNDTTLYGHSSFRELQLLIDGNLAGVAWPFPVIFTGGIVPGFWRPVVGIDAFDLKEDEIDITPFLPLLNDGNTHAFEIRVVGIDDDGKGNGQLTENIESNWVVTGKIFIWTGTAMNLSIGTVPIISAPAPSIKLQSITKRSVNGTVSALDYSIQVSRQLSVESTIMTSAGSQTVSWKQDLTFSNTGTLSNGGNDQVDQQATKGTSISSTGFSRSFDYPLWVISSYNAPAGGNVTIDAKIARGKNVQQTGDLAFLNEWRTFDHASLHSTPYSVAFTGSNTTNWQNGTASYLSVPAIKKSFGTGTTEQFLILSGTAGSVDYGSGKLYQRHIIAANNTVVSDQERFGDQAVQRSRINLANQSPIAGGLDEYAGRGVRALLGRGPL
ncbi:hypothetical protein HBI56_218300 [Parastagonospora nodorum]|uniref:Peptide N-acetyl-beta-D-glucosaminyl asparaginase amidase A N-terminal domain-containing protein n=2 Tax=Phaeosphaeria nodorum (strain SN15 / ATCC MYA-4574 / FGSC 10173) TaxID=321614 RepID=A0A7U2FFA3_PHANO|nr:hypothetical protein HBH56_225760 [Parastagonospora nodorum]QRD01841.1 hypothetical protein JI435_048250 [Parastagonospora nodorum SN15]KAH3935341.1 hypothetical protein HBH54_032970 [Parastagonospora nodorum]KAH3940003.1 hypothetical protein HBH53_223800 [Parastagonospora nodorum]KAH3957587.1 hypothetical protein HBH51_222910 [Parastagonospora nodorum]